MTGSVQRTKASDPLIWTKDNFLIDQSMHTVFYMIACKEISRTE